MDRWMKEGTNWPADVDEAKSSFTVRPFVRGQKIEKEQNPHRSAAVGGVVPLCGDPFPIRQCPDWR